MLAPGFPVFPSSQRSGLLSSLPMYTLSHPQACSPAPPPFMFFYMACLPTSLPSCLFREKGVIVVVNARTLNHSRLCVAVLLSLEYHDEESVEPTFEDCVNHEIM